MRHRSSRAMYSFAEAGRILGISERAVSAMVYRIGIPVFDHPSNARAKAIDQAGLDLLDERLAPTLSASA